jgi:carboxymethylenebutenolidase
MASSTQHALSDLQSLSPEAAPENRRDFLVSTLAVGFALAVHPISAQTIKTDAVGLVAGEVKIPTADGQIPAYRACPAKGRAFPIVLVVQEIFGVHEHIKDLCRRLAKAGYCAVAPELYARQGDVSKIENVQEIISTVVSKVPDAQVMSDLDATAAWAAKSSRGAATRLAVTGFCWGGRIAWLYAAHNPKLKAAAAWYGQIEGNHTPLTPKFPLDYAGALKCPVIGFYGGKDTGITQESVAQMQTSLKVVGDPSEINVYPEAQHGFNADYRPSYNKADAEDAWKKMLAWFKKYGC